MLLSTDVLDTVNSRLSSLGERRSTRLSPWGHMLLSSSGSGLHGVWYEPFGYYLTGNGYRGYLPQLMRFASPDSLSPFGKGGLNAYGFCLGDPVNVTDATGHFPLPVAAIRSLDEVLEAGRAIASHLDSASVIALSSVSRSWRNAISLERAAAAEAIRIRRYAYHADKLAEPYVFARLTNGDVPSAELMNSRRFGALALPEDTRRFLGGTDRLRLDQAGAGTSRLRLVHDVLTQEFPVPQVANGREDPFVMPIERVRRHLGTVRFHVRDPEFWKTRLPPLR